MLMVSDNHRYLLDDGAPFFWLGDTAWELFHRLDRDEADLYLRDRAVKGYNVIQAVALAEFDGLTEPNRYGHLPLIDQDPARPNEAYFEHVDWIVARCGELGMYCGLLPTWGDKVNKKWGKGPEVFTPENARVYGEWLGRRYRDARIVWISGGDRPSEEERHFAIYRALAEGLRAGDGGAHLITYHPSGFSSSSRFYHADTWLNLNMIQSGHGARDIDTGQFVAHDLGLEPAKPTLDGEPCYEDHPINWNPELGWFDEYDVRKAVYRSVFAGACGVTYGCHDIWQFFSERHPPVSHARTPWRQALALPASGQMLHLKRLMLSRPYLSRIPDAGLLVDPPDDPPARCAATRDADGSYALIYTPLGRPVKVDLTHLAPRLTAWWYSPRDAACPWTGEVTGGQHEFTPPSSGPGHDWVLVLDDATRGWPAPGMEG